MKRPLLYISLLLLLTACPKDPEHELIGTWILIEQRVDIGDGKSTFTAVNSDKTLEFKADSSVISNGSICTMSDESDKTDAAIYNSLRGIIQSPGCAKNITSIYYSVEDGYLILSYPCVEPCQQKFKKLE